MMEEEQKGPTITATPSEPEDKDKKLPAPPISSESPRVQLLDHERPLNWPPHRKYLALALSSLLTTIPPVTAAIVAPALSHIRQDFAIDSKVAELLVLSSWQLTFNCAPLVLGPLSETCGRVAVLQAGMLWFVGCNAMCGWSRDAATMIACRFLAGLGGGAGVATGYGVVTDLFDARERGNAIALYNLGPMLSPAIGPVFSAFVVQYSDWRWSFHAVTIWTVVVLFASLFLLQETRESVLLSWKDWAQRVEEDQSGTRRSTMSATCRRMQAQFAEAWKKTPRALIRPMQMLARERAVQALALLNAYFYGMMGLAIATFPSLYGPVYHQTISIAGLHYIALALGYLSGGYLCKWAMDKIYNHLRQRVGGPEEAGRPEFRIPLMIIGSTIVPLGLLLSGWSAQYAVHWIVPDIGAFIFSAGIMVSMQSSTNYMVDAYTEYAASAIGATWFLRGLAGFALPILSPYLYGELDFGWGTTLLALVALVVGLPAPLLLWRYGEALRAASSFSKV